MLQKPWKVAFYSKRGASRRYHRGMNVLCIECGKLFSINAAQLGSKGRCPHCKSAVQMPASVDQVQAQQTRVVADRRIAERTLLAGVVLLVHVFALLLLAKLPWYSTASQTAEIEHHFVLRPPTEPRLKAPPIPRLQPVPVKTLSLQSYNAVTAIPSPQRSTVSESQSRFGDPASADPSFGDLPEFIADANSGMTHWEKFRRQADGLITVESFDELLDRLGNDGLDVAIVFDSTASMDREIAQVREGIERIGKTLIKAVPKTRISVCTYRDQGDQYVTKGLELTESVAQVSTFLNEIRAQGGGDKSESVTAGVRWVIENNQFRPQAKKVILIFGDAPPKPDQRLTCQQLVSDFRFKQRGVVSTVTCDQNEKLASFVELAEIGGGESFLNNEETDIVQQLLVLVFGSRYQEELLSLELSLQAENGGGLFP